MRDIESVQNILLTLIKQLSPLFVGDGWDFTEVKIAEFLGVRMKRVGVFFRKYRVMPLKDNDAVVLPHLKCFIQPHQRTLTFAR